MKSDGDIPAHIAIVMDGNGRWAKQRRRPRSFGHQAGVKALRRVVKHCGRLGVATLTVFAFSSENWNRPQKEVNRLLDLFMRALDKETRELHENGIRVRFIGGLDAFAPELREKVRVAEQQTRDNQRMTLNVAVNYGGRWDIVQAARRLAGEVASGNLRPGQIDEKLFASRLALHESGDPDLLIRTGGEMRISNFLLWQSAYTELFFSQVLWPDYGQEAMDEAIAAFRSRERRFGLTGEQVHQKTA